MTSSDILDLLNESILFKNINFLNTLDEITWKCEESNSNTILFYALSDTLEGKQAFLERLKSTQYGILITDLDLTETQAQSNVIVVKKENWLICQKILCDKIYPFENECFLAGITGTNGKTTTADLVLQLGHQNELKVLTIGTLGVQDIDGLKFETGLTTPPYIWNRKFIHQYKNEYDLIVFEVSSHSLVQERVYNILFDVCAWTSFSQDHLDYHKSLDSYFSAKLKIITHLKENGSLIIPNDQEYLLKNINYKNLKQARKFQDILKSKECPIFLENQFNRNNFMCAYHILLHIVKKDLTVDFKEIRSTPGRFNIIEWKTRRIIIDFAHTPDALENIGKSLKKTYLKSRIITVFGCGGNRDKTKRPLMASAVSGFSDYAYITSDNPRFENPADIISDISKAMTIKYETNVDREQSLRKSLCDSIENDIILVAGKGHENYIDINGKKVKYSDFDVINRFIKEEND